MANNKTRNDIKKDVDIKEENITRQENPSLVGATFIKYAAYVIMLLVVLYFLITYILPLFYK